MAKLRRPQVREWHESLATAGLSKASVNRTQIALNAALNLAVTRMQASIEKASAWREVKPFKGAANRRDLFLDLAQRRALLAATNSALRNILSGAMFTGHRAGEMVGALCRQFDVRTSIREGPLDPRPNQGQSSAISTFGQTRNCDGVGKARR